MSFLHNESSVSPLLHEKERDGIDKENNMKLSKKVIDSLEPKETDFLVSDSKLPGFYVRIWPSGNKAYIVQYRAEGRVKRYKIANHGTLTFEQARQDARIILGKIARGDDPAKTKATRRNAITINQLCDDYFALADKGLIMGRNRKPKKTSTLYTDKGRCDAHIRPLLGGKKVIDVKKSDIHQFLTDVADGKTATVKKSKKPRGKAMIDGGKGTATRTTGLLSGILSYAVERSIIEQNPCHGVRKYADTKKQRRLSHDEYRALGNALRKAEMDGEPWQVITGVWLLTMIGGRLGDIVNLKWSNLDVHNRCFRLDESKTGASTRPIGNAVFHFLSHVKQDSENPYVLLPIRKQEGPFGSLSSGFEKIIRLAGLESKEKGKNVTPHVLRHSFASVAADMGCSDSTIAALLGHSTGTVTSRYIHTLDSTLVEAANRVTEEIERQMGNATTEYDWVI